MIHNCTNIYNIQTMPLGILIPSVVLRYRSLAQGCLMPMNMCDYKSCLLWSSTHVCPKGGIRWTQPHPCPLPYQNRQMYEALQPSFAHCPTLARPGATWYGDCRITGEAKWIAYGSRTRVHFVGHSYGGNAAVGSCKGQSIAERATSKKKGDIRRKIISVAPALILDGGCPSYNHVALSSFSISV